MILAERIFHDKSVLFSFANNFLRNRDSFKDAVITASHTASLHQELLSQYFMMAAITMINNQYINAS